MIPRKFITSDAKQKQRESSDPAATLRWIQDEWASLRKLNSVPSDESVLRLLRQCQNLAESLISPPETKAEAHGSLREGEGGGSAISSLLDLEERNNTSRHFKTSKDAQTHLANAISKIANDILRDKKVFISPEALECYTKIQVSLKRAEHFPEIFHLYAHKPVPEANSSPVKYHQPDPKSVKSAVPTDVANMALDVAIHQRNLPLVLAIIDQTFCAPAFHRAKIFKKAALPLSGLAAAPAACYAVASWASTFQNTMDPSTATGIAFAAILAYVAGTSSVGVLAVTTANDQMQRVVWLPGVPLRYRWLREEERAALDKVAVAWGFKDAWMRGEEEGEEWDSLREFIGLRGMILDKSDLMEGMQ